MSKRKLPVFPLWIDDYEADTRGFTFEEHGFYLRLLFAMWRRQAEISDDSQVIARALGTDIRVINRLLKTVGPKLQRNAGSYTSSRLQKEWNFAVSKSEKLRELAKHAAGKRWQNQQNSDARSNAASNAAGTAGGNADRNARSNADAMPPLRKKDIISSLPVAARASEQPDGSPRTRQGEGDDKSYLFETEFMQRAKPK